MKRKHWQLLALSALIPLLWSPASNTEMTAQAAPGDAPNSQLTAANDPAWNKAIWRNMNPGAGGNIQGIDVDPNTPNRMWLLSDMEGLYRSDDAGANWKFQGGNLSYAYTNAVTAEPGNARRVYLGTVGGLEISDDEGDSWKRVEGIRDSIGQIAVDPKNPNRVWALPGRRHRWEDDVQGARSSLGARDFYSSSDRGVTWQTAAYAPGEGRRDILSWSFDATNANHIVMGALTGVYESKDGGKSWQLLPAPASGGDCLGAAISPDGTRIYATYRVGANGGQGIVTTREGDIGGAGQSHLFVTAADKVSWTNVTAGASGFDLKPTDAALFWRPEPDPKGAGRAQQLLIGAARPQRGVWTVDVTRNGDKFSANWKRALFYDADKVAPNFNTVAFDTGWEHWGINGEDYGYAPPSWNSKLIYATGGQTFYVADSAAPDWDASWDPRYTRQVSAQRVGEQKVRFYRTRGTQSTYMFDAEAYKNYAVASVADNGLMESYDGGYSWTGDLKPAGHLDSRSNAVVVLRGLNPPLVVAHTATGWGADNWKETNELWAKKLVSYGLDDKWVRIAGGENHLAGWGGDEVGTLAVDPRNPRRLAVSRRFGGINIIENVEALYDAAAANKPLPKMSSPTRLALPPKPAGSAVLGTSMVFDPDDSGVLWVAGPNAFWKGTRQNGDENNWQWQKVLDGDSLDFAVWKNGAQKLIAVRRPAGSGNDTIDLSRDDGKTWTPIISYDKVKALRTNNWLRPDLPLRVGAMVAQGDHLYFSYAPDVKSSGRATGFYRATIGENGLRKVEDFTADLPFALPVRVRIVDSGNGPQMLFCSRGNGLWGRSLK